MAAVCIALLGWPGEAAARCFELLGQGATAHRAGDLDAAEATLREGLGIEACRGPSIGPLLRFSLGQVLLDRAEATPERACDAVVEFAAARDATDSDVSKAADERLAEARAACRAARRPVTPPPTPMPLPEPPSPFTFGPQVGGGISGLALGRFVEGEVRLGAALELGVALAYRLTPEFSVLLDPAVTFAGLSYARSTPTGEQSAEWRWTTVEGTVGAAWHPLGGALSVMAGARVGGLIEATESAASSEASIDMAPLLVDAVLGGAWGWAVSKTQIRASLRGGLGLLRLNPSDDPAGLHGYRLALSVAALF